MPYLLLFLRGVYEQEVGFLTNVNVYLIFRNEYAYNFTIKIKKKNFKYVRIIVSVSQYRTF